MPDNSLSCSSSNPDYRRQLAEQAAAEQSDRTCHQNQCEAPPAKPAVPACRDERSVEAEARAAGYKPTRASSELAHKASVKKRARGASAHAAKKSSAKPTDTNAERTMARRPGPYAGAGVTSSGDSVYAGAALTKGKDGQGSADLFSVSGQVGAQNEFQAGMGRGHVDLTQSASIQGDWEVFTAHAAAGIHNEDGSTGLNESIGATIVKFGATFQAEGAELHLGLGAGAGPPSAHVGVRDPDHDGRQDVCVGGGALGAEASLCLPNLIRW